MAKSPLPRFAEYTRRLLWYFRGEFPGCVFVALAKRVEEGAEPFFRTAGDAVAGDGTWHVARDCKPAPDGAQGFSIDASSRDLEQLESDWVWTHQEGCGHEGEWVNYGEFGRTDLEPIVRETEAPDWTARNETK